MQFTRDAKKKEEIEHIYVQAIAHVDCVQYIVLLCNKFIKNNRYVLHSAGESLVLLGIVVLEADLQVDGLHELAFFGLLGMLEHLGHALKEGFLRYFTKIQRKMRLEGLG